MDLFLQGALAISRGFGCIAGEEANMFSWAFWSALPCSLVRGLGAGVVDQGGPL